MSSYKILVLGDVGGQLKSVFAKVAKLHAKQDFAFAIITGNLFPSTADETEVQDLLAHNILVPIPTYFTVAYNTLPQAVVDRLQNNEEICPNLTFLAKRSTLLTTEGLKIVTLGGKPAAVEEIEAGPSKDPYSPIHTRGDANSLRGANTADILLTTTWPASIRKGNSKAISEGMTDPEGRDYVSDLCVALKPRYHFSASAEFFFERDPFYHAPNEEDPEFKAVTRFISLAAHGNDKKEKAMYAFSLPRIVDKTAPLPVNTTVCPFNIRESKRPLDANPYSRFSGSERNIRRRGGHGGGYRPKPGPELCFFCLGSNVFESHSVVSIGDNSFLSIAKGPLLTSTTNAEQGLDFPGHALIMPMLHEPTLVAHPDGDREVTWTEMNKYKSSLQNMIASVTDNKIGSVTYEISKGENVHHHWQFVPIPTSHLPLVSKAFMAEAENRQYPDFQARDPGIGMDEGDFFRAWIWSPPSKEQPEGSTECIIMPFDYTTRFDLQYGRVVLAKLLGLQARLQWRDCIATKEEETREREFFKSKFNKFDLVDMAVTDAEDAKDMEMGEEKPI